MTSKNLRFIGLSLFTIVTLAIVYSGHFDNGFYFDDKHTIVNNNSIKTIEIVDFFTDSKTFSSLPGNQTYRPLTTLENATDYVIGGGLNPKVFHSHIFTIYIFLGIAIYFLALLLLRRNQSSNYNQYIALLISAMFCFLCANTQTVNYIIQRAEITAALFVVLGLIFYIHDGFLRKTYLYLIFPFIGFFAKEMAFIFPFLLFVYILILEEKVYIFNLKSSENIKGILNTIKKTVPAFAVMFLFYFLVYKPAVANNYVTANSSAFNYFITQPMAIAHYMVSYFFPYNLSLDSDWTAYGSIADYRVILGFLIHFVILFFTLKVSHKKNLRLFTFGILWFYVALIPSSSIIALSEVMNDHRAFLAYIGLTIAFVTLLHNMYVTLKNRYDAKRIKLLAYIFLFTFFSGNIYGIIQRNKVWDNAHTLWKDTTIKSPNNGRALMNYGVVLMREARYNEAEKYFKKALKLIPKYHYLHINLSIIENQKGNTSEAEAYLKQAENLKPDYMTLYFYANFLKKNNRIEEAEEKLLKSIQLSNSYPNSLNLLQDIYKETGRNNELKKLANFILTKDPKNRKAIQNLNSVKNESENLEKILNQIKTNPTPENYLSLSLFYYRAKNYEESKNASLKAIELNPNYADAFNNLGISCFMLNDYNAAVTAYEKAIKINPNYELAINNLANAKKSKSKMRDYHINQSLLFYNKGLFLECINSAKKSIEIEPTSNAYNNICTAYNRLEDYQKAIAACEKAIQLNKNNKLAKGNLTFAKNKLKN
ncbi:tetratricopeptide repeat protein [Tenacibaculum sp. 190524A05c]|uniref:Protein O-mannosyl-transferase n=1 Tax=Tenacibaculum platacis TaxID=3137852 RepID=A0ABM9P425_9FLAO